MIRSRVAAYYSDKVRQHGATAQGVDWNSAESQRIRFDQLLGVLGPGDVEYSLLDYGCGYGALADELSQSVRPYRYVGYDLSEDMVRLARTLHGPGEHEFTTDRNKLSPSDYAVASGVLNVKLETPVETWKAHVLEVIGELDALSIQGFAFNALTSYSDPDRMRDDLHYADPCEMLDYCVRTVSRKVAVLHDYGLYEFTVLVRKQQA